MQLQDNRRRQRRLPTDSQSPLRDRDLLDRSEAPTRPSIDARVVARESMLVETLDTLRVQMRNQKSILLPVFKRLAQWTVSQFGTLSRVSARPAALARMASAHQIRRQPMVVRVVLVPMAALFIGLGVALQVTSGLGVGPGDMVASGISAKTGLSFGSAAIIMSSLLALAGTLLGRPPKLATVINVAMIAVLVDLFLPLLAIEGGFLSRALHFAVGLWSVGLGLGCLLHARLGIGTHEALSLSIAERLRVPVKKVRFAQELSWIVLGLSLGSQFGVGTIAVAIFIGPVIAGGTRTVGRALTALSNAVESPEVAAHVTEVSF